VTDTGIGIAQQKIASIFERFTQEDSSTTRQYGGTGLGLAIVKKLCLLMGGDITVTSNQGQGSTFSFTLLLEACDQIRAELPQVDLSAYRILIVDDNKTNREVLYSQLTLWGARVSQVDSARSALSCLNESLTETDENVFDIAILDMLMPEMNGAQLGQQIRANKKWQNLKLIMLTSLVRPGDAQYFTDLGFDYSLSKPIITADLAKALVLVANKTESENQQQLLPGKKTNKPITIKPLPKSTRILLVEDNSINQVVAQNLLQNLGAQVAIANNGEEAITMLDKDYYDVVLMDCQMPIMDGYTATKMIRKSHQGYQDIYIIAMTANAMSGDRDKCLAAGMNDYLTKPIDTIALEHSLLEALNMPFGHIKTIKSAEVEQNTLSSENDAQTDEVWGKKAFYKRVGQNQALAQRIATMYCQDMPEEIKKLSQAITIKDNKLIAAIAHKIKGSSANIEAVRLAYCALNIEQAIRENNHAELELLSIELNESFNEIIGELESFLATTE